MSSENEKVVYSPTDGAAPVASASDVEMVVASDSSGAQNTKNIRNVQTQHGDYRYVDAENIFLIARCLWPEEEEKKQFFLKPSTSNDAANKETDTVGAKEEDAVEEDAEQVVWIEPFANEVSVFDSKGDFLF